MAVQIQRQAWLAINISMIIIYKSIGVKIPSQAERPTAAA